MFQYLKKLFTCISGEKNVFLLYGMASCNSSPFIFLNLYGIVQLD